MEYNNWSVIYKKAIQNDGTLLFPQRLSLAFLENAKKTMGSYLFANQYQNEIIPIDEQTFKREWLKYYQVVPDRVYHFAFVDPAISEADTADFTGICVIAADVEQNWYVKYAERKKINPSQLIELLFQIHDKYQTKIIGIEDVAFQRAIIHFAHEEMKRRGKHIPLFGVKRGNDRTKETRILSLVPRFEWGSIFLKPGLSDLELEMGQFPRGAHDDILDALCSLQEIVYYPNKTRSPNEPLSPNDPRYESEYIQRLIKRSKGGSEE